jgi:glucosamine--fructose-6-phosphate aminotransferase (isomerizing)
MCGIVGYVGERDALPILMDGLRRLEYRGYDSAGVAVAVNGHLEVRRSEGKLSNLDRVVAERPVSGVSGIGHTRWATHGRPTEHNAHPHVDCDAVTAVIHNGIVENYRELKDGLRSRGHAFKSETDTEVIVHLVEEKLREGLTLEEAARRSLTQIQGAAAVVLLSATQPDTIIAARISNAGGVIVGFGEGETFVASDMPAILEHTRTFSFLDHGEMAVVTPGEVRFRKLDGSAIEKPRTSVAFDLVTAAKSGFKHFMLKEIYEQPRAISDTLLGRVDRERARVIFDEDVRMSEAQARALQRISIVACGTSFHAGLVGKYLIERLAGIPTDVEIASEYRYREPAVLPGQVVLGLTQSGETVDTLAAMEEAKRRGARLVWIGNVVGSQASRMADDVIYLHAGPEIAVAASKTYTATLVDLFLFALFLAQRRDRVDEARSRALLAAAYRLPTLVDQALGADEQVRALAHRYYSARDFLHLGRGPNYATALEGALKLKELSYAHAEGTAGGEMKHGINALIDEHLPVLAVAPRDSTRDKMLSNIEQVRARAGIVVAVATQGDDAVREKADEVIEIPACDELLSPVLAIVPLQLFAYHVADRRGCDVDQPRNLAKTVTVE